LISWAKNPIEIPEYKAGQQVNLTQKIHNITDANATKVKLTLLSPDRREIHTETHDFSLVSGEEKEITFTHTAPTFLGIYFVDYTLLDESGDVIQPQAEGERFCVSGHYVTYDNPQLTFAITSPFEQFPYGTEASFTFHIWNNSNDDRIVTAKWHLWGSPEKTNTLSIPAHTEGTFNEEITVRSNAGLFASFYDENGNRLGSASRDIRVYNPSLNVKVATDKKLYSRGESLSVKLELQDRSNQSYQTQVKLAVFAPENIKILARDLDINLSASGSGSERVTFTLPSVLSGGVYRVQAEAFSQGQKVGLGLSSFEVPIALVAATPILPSHFVAQADNQVSLKLENKGMADITDGQVDIFLSDPNNNVIPTSTKDFALAVGQETTLDFSVPLSEVILGKYELSYVVTYSGKSFTNKVELPNLVRIVPSFDKPSYRIRENMNLKLELTNDGKFSQDNMAIDVSVPDAGFADSQTISLNPGQRSTIPYIIPLPETLSAGQHSVIVTTKLANSSTKNFTFSIPESKLNLSLDKTSFINGEDVSIAIENTGGVDTTGDYQAKLIDSCGLQIYELIDSTKILAGEKKNLTFPIPEAAVTGDYQLLMDCWNTGTSETTSLRKNLQIKGLEATLDVRTDKKEYLTTDPKNILAEIRNLDGLINNGIVNLKVFSTQPWAIPPQDTSGYPAPSNIIHNFRNLPGYLEISNDYLDIVVDAYTGSYDLSRFTFGTTGGDLTNPNDDWKVLLYGHPYPWSSFTTVRIDGEDFVYGTNQGIFTSLPHFEGDAIACTWKVNDVSITQRITIDYSASGNPDLGRIAYSIETDAPHEVGIRLMMDTMLGENDGSPFRILGVGDVVTEKEFVGTSVPPVWMSLDSLISPTS
ncbi:MAG: hypothetical protein QXH58_04490, partial [Nitrososphaerales archaeon]